MQTSSLCNSTYREVRWPCLKIMVEQEAVEERTSMQDISSVGDFKRRTGAEKLEVVVGQS